MRRWWKWTKRITLFVIAFAVFAIAVTIGALHTDWGRNRLRGVVVDQLQSTFPGSTIGRVDGSVLGDLILRDVVIMAKDGKPLATIETLVVSAAIRPLVGKTVLVESVIADNVVVYVRPQPAEPAKPAQPSKPS